MLSNSINLEMVWKTVVTREGKKYSRVRYHFIVFHGLQSFYVEILSLPQILYTLGNLWYSMKTEYSGNNIESKWREADELEQANGFARGTIISLLKSLRNIRRYYKLFCLKIYMPYCEFRCSRVVVLMKLGCL